MSAGLPTESGLSRSVLVLRAGFALSRLSTTQLWLDYLQLTGTLTQTELTDLLRGGRDEVPPGEHDLLAHVLNEHFDDLGLGSLVLYAEDLQQPLPPPRRASRDPVAAPEGRRPVVELTAAPVGITVAARLIGVSPGTLRSWQHRYDLGPTAHQAGAHRRYSPRDLARLELMHQALLHGYATADAARFALTIPATDLDDPSSPVTVPTIRPGADGPRTGTTPTLPMPGAGPAAAGLARAVLALDTLGTHTVLAHQIELVGPLRVWEDMVRPVMNAIATRWAATGHGVEVEHLLSEAVATTFAHAELAAPAPTSTATVLLAAAPGEHHYLPLRILAAVLRHRGVTATVLGGDVPLTALTATITRTGPRAVLLWAQLDANADPAALTQLPELQPPTQVFVAGPAWAHHELPPSVHLLRTLDDAADTLTATTT